MHPVGSLPCSQKHVSCFPVLRHVIQATVFHPSCKLPATPRHSKWYLFFKLLHQNSTCVSDLPHTFRMPHPFSDQCRPCSCTVRRALYHGHPVAQSGDLAVLAAVPNCEWTCKVTNRGHVVWCAWSCCAVPAVISAIFSLRPLPCVSVITGFVSRRSAKEV